jgi:DnaJ-class molecular chaperone
VNSDPFRDEVAIDFPSIGPVVERVREAFLSHADADRDLLRVSVQISSRDAYLGTIVPIDVPVRAICAICGGRGETWAETCEECGGKGDHREQSRVRVPIPPGIAHGSRLHFRVRSAETSSLRIEVTVVVAEERLPSRDRRR